jgi:predicted AlkP superfamily pyrophosphatase or phosphodiesterase
MIGSIKWWLCLGRRRSRRGVGSGGPVRRSLTARRAAEPRKRVAVLKSVAVLVMALTLSAPGTRGQAGRQASGPKTQQPRIDEHVIIISIDGMMPDYYMKPATMGLKIPALSSMRLGGAYAAGMYGVYPSTEYPTHATMVTGVNPQFHGITNDSIFEGPGDFHTAPGYSFASALKSEPVWSAAQRGGLTTASVGWTSTAGAQIDYNLPEVWAPDDDPLTGKQAAPYATPGLLQEALAGNPKAQGDELRALTAAYIIKTYKPNLVLLRLVELEQTHLKFGPGSRAAMQTMEREDDYLNRVVQAARDSGIYDRTTFIVVSDHGSASVSKVFEPNVVLAKAKLMTLDASGKPTEWKAAAWPAGGSCAIVLRDPKDKATADLVSALFAKIPLRSRSPLDRIVNRLELDRIEAMPGVSLMLDGAPEYYIDGAFTGPQVRGADKSHRGESGYVPTRSAMWASLIVSGHAVRVGARIEISEMIDIAPTAAAILGVDMPDAEGLPIVELIKPEYIPPSDPQKQKRQRDRKAAEEQKPSSPD